MNREKLYEIFSNIPVLETERLFLRAMRRADAQDMYEYAQRADVTRFLLWVEHSSLAYTEEYLKYIESRYAIGDFYDWAVVLKDSGKMIGTCGFAKIDTLNDSAELGYVLNPEYRGKGIAAEAAERVVRFGFEELKLNRIEARFMQGNEASLRVMEKLGMSFEGFERQSIFVKGSYQTVGKCAILFADFNKKE
jgi:ribosomal-protein-alanine N-acetyltransferase